MVKLINTVTTEVCVPCVRNDSMTPDLCEACGLPLGGGWGVGLPASQAAVSVSLPLDLAVSKHLLPTHTHTMKTLLFKHSQLEFDSLAG